MSAATEPAQRYVGQGVLRKEDPELVTGQARYIDDLTLPGMVWMTVVRSPHAHARIRKVDVSAALARPGVVAAFTGEDLASEWAAGCPARGRSRRRTGRSRSTPIRACRRTGRSRRTRRASPATASRS